MRFYPSGKVIHCLFAAIVIAVMTGCSTIEETSAPTSQPVTETPIPVTPSPPPTSTPTPPPVDCDEQALREAVAAGGEITLAENCTYHLTDNLPPFTSDIEIIGNNAIIDGGGQYAVFYSQQHSLRIEFLTIRNAYHPDHSPAIYTEEGDISIYEGYFYDNQTEASGGAIGSQSGRIEITVGEFRGNQAVISGGAISSSGDQIDVLETIFVENTSVGCGGAIFIDGGTIQAESSAFINNKVTVHGGGALCLGYSSYLYAVASTFSGNRSGRGGGGIAGAEGSGLELISCTVTDNHASRGGGIWTDTSLSLQQTIVAGNTAYIAEDIMIESSEKEPFISLGYNLIGEPGDLPLEETDIVASQGAGLGELVDNGHPPLPGSPALDAVPEDECALSLDQYGYPRPQGEGCDIGAVEARE